MSDTVGSPGEGSLATAAAPTPPDTEAAPDGARKQLVAEALAEALGTFMILIFGCGMVAQVVGGGSGLGDHDSIAWGWGFGVMLGIFVAGRISGAHLNPAVTAALAMFTDFP